MTKIDKPNNHIRPASAPLASSTSTFLHSPVNRAGFTSMKSLLKTESPPKIGRNHALSTSPTQSTMTHFIHSHKIALINKEENIAKKKLEQEKKTDNNNTHVTHAMFTASILHPKPQRKIVTSELSAEDMLQRMIAKNC